MREREILRIGGDKGRMEEKGFKDSGWKKKSQPTARCNVDVSLKPGITFNVCEISFSSSECKCSMFTVRFVLTQQCCQINAMSMKQCTE